MKKRSHIPVCSLLFLALGTPAGADQVYTWIDAAGVTHFSDESPEDSALEIDRLHMSTPAEADRVSGDDYYSVINQATRMEARRLESAKSNALRKRAEAEARRADAEALATIEINLKDYSEDDTRYYPLYPYYPHHRHHKSRKHSRKRPGHLPDFHRPGFPSTRPGHVPAKPAAKSGFRWVKH
jgi:hypothetical protein